MARCDAINLIEFITRCVLGSFYIPRRKKKKTKTNKYGRNYRREGMGAGGQRDPRCQSQGMGKAGSAVLWQHTSAWRWALCRFRSPICALTQHEWNGLKPGRHTGKDCRAAGVSEPQCISSEQKPALICVMQLKRCHKGMCLRR